MKQHDFTNDQWAVIIQGFGWLKECRHFGAQFGKPAVNFHAMPQRAIIGRCLRRSFEDRA